LNRNRWIIVGVVFALLVGWMIVRTRSGAQAPKYRTAAVDRGTIEATVSATGTVNPVEQVEVGSQVSGTVSKLFADFNTHVKKGQVLLEIEPSSFRARVEQNQAAVAKAQALVLDGERTLRRSNELMAQNVISKTDLETAQVTLAQRKADLQSAQAQLRMSQVDLGNTVIRAPIDGVVIDREIDVGQTVAASLQAPKLFVIAQSLNQMQVETSIDEADIGVIRPGLPVSFTVDAYPDVNFDGTVQTVRLQPIVTNNVVTYTVIVQTGNPGLRLRPGMTANVTVRVARHEDVMRVPNAALRFRPPNAGMGRGRGGAGGAQATAGGGQGGGFGGAGGGQGGRAGGTPAANASDGQAARTFAGGGASGDSAGARRWRGGVGGMARGGFGRGGGRDSLRRGGAWAGRGGFGGGPTRPGGLAVSPEAPDTSEASALKPGTIYVLRNDKPQRVPVLAGITDGAFTEVVSQQLQVGDPVILGMDVPVANNTNNNLQPPPGMGGPRFGGRGGGGGRGR
jgi:HlyD family secretion protein